MVIQGLTPNYPSDTHGYHFNLLTNLDEHPSMGSETTGFWDALLRTASSRFLVEYSLGFSNKVL